MSKSSIEQAKLTDQITTCIEEINLLKKIYQTTLKDKHITGEQLISVTALRKAIFIDIGTLFDKDRESVSLYQLFGNLVIENWGKQHGINKFTKSRNKLIAHLDRKKLQMNPLDIILNRDMIKLKTFLQDLKSKVESFEL